MSAHTNTPTIHAFTKQPKRKSATGLGLSVVYAGLAHLAFYSCVQRARRTGLLLKMSE